MISQTPNFNELEKLTGYHFDQPELLLVALTHPSFTNECKGKTGRASYQRMEFLGDAVLQIIISDYLYSNLSDDMEEGDLTDFRKHLVCGATLARLAKKIDLGSFLLLGKGEEKEGGREKEHNLACAFEAYIAAVYLDSNHDTSFLTMFLLGLMKSEIENYKTAPQVVSGDFKSRLQRLVQQDGHEKLSYRVVSESGPDHDKTFEVHAMLNSNCFGRGCGRSKKEAEQAAARDALVHYFGEKV